MNPRTLVVTLLAAALLSGVALHALAVAGTAAFPPPADCRSEVDASAGVNILRGCQDTAITVTTTTVCSVCAGGLNVVFIRSQGSEEQEWQRSTAARIVAELERYTGSFVQAAVIENNFRQVKVLVPMTDRMATVRAALGRLEWGRDHTSDFEVAARLAISVLDDAAKTLPAGVGRPCEIVVAFVTTKPAETADGMKMLRGSLLIRDRGTPLLVGCPVTDMEWCGYQRQMVEREAWFAEPPDEPKLASATRDILENFQRIVLVRAARLDQAVPSGLSYVPDSAIPPATVSNAVAGPNRITMLSWLIDRPPPGTTLTVTYRVAGEAVGAHAVTGSYAVTDVDGRAHVQAAPTVLITVAEVCETATAMPTPTAMIEPPTPTAIPLSATPTPAPELLPIYLPLGLVEHCDATQQRIDVALVIDASSSMSELTRAGRPKKDAALEAARAFLDLLQFDVRAGDQAAIVAFNSEGRLLAPLTSNRSVLEAALGEVSLSQQTRLDLAVAVGAEALADAARRREANQPILILLTDGRANPVPVEVAVSEAERAKAAGNTLFTIGLGDDLDADALASMASRPQDFLRAPDAENLADVYRSVARSIPCPADAWWGGR